MGVCQQMFLILALIPLRIPFEKRLTHPFLGGGKFLVLLHVRLLCVKSPLCKSFLCKGFCV